MQVYVKCSLVYMDFEGRSDGGSIKKILSHVSPLKLVRISFVLLASLNIFLHLIFWKKLLFHLHYILLPI